MSRFFLHIDDGTTLIVDHEGSDLPDLAAAREEAIFAARQLWASAIGNGRDLGNQRFRIAEADGNVIHTVAMDDALPRAMVERLKL